MQQVPADASQMSYPGPSTHSTPSPSLSTYRSPRLRNREQSSAQASATQSQQRATRSAQAPAGQSPGERIPSFSANTALSSVSTLASTQYGAPGSAGVLQSTPEEAQGPMPIFWSAPVAAEAGKQTSPNRQSRSQQPPLHRNSGTPSMGQHRTSGAMNQQVPNLSPRLRGQEKRSQGEHKTSPRGPLHEAKSDIDKENVANAWLERGDPSMRYADNLIKAKAESWNHCTKLGEDTTFENQSEMEYRRQFLTYEKNIAQMAEELSKKERQEEKLQNEIDMQERIKLVQIDKYKSEIANLSQDLKGHKDELKTCKSTLRSKDEQLQKKEGELQALRDDVRKKGIELDKKETAVLEAQRESQRQVQREAQCNAQQDLLRAKDELKRLGAEATARDKEAFARETAFQQEYQLQNNRFLKLKQQNERMASNTSPGEFLKMVKARESGVQVWQQLAHLRERVADLEKENEVQRQHLTPAAVEAVARELGQPLQEPSS